MILCVQQWQIILLLYIICRRGSGLFAKITSKDCQGNSLMLCMKVAGDCFASCAMLWWI